LKDYEIKVFSGSSHPGLSKEIAEYLGLKLGEIDLKKFSNGENYARFLENIRGRDVFLVQSLFGNVNDHLVELLIMLDAAKRSSAERITAVIPHYAYARQDRKADSREPITAKLVADLLSKAGANRVITMDLHSDQIQGFFDIPVDNLTASIKLMEYVKEKEFPNLVVVAPDAGSAKNSTRVAKALEVELAIINKIRPRQGVAEAMHVIGDVKGKDCVLFDDMIDTAGTICAAADALKKNGCKSVSVCATHGIFSNPAIERIEKSGIDEVVITDTISGNGNKCKKIKCIGTAGLFGEAIERIHSNKSVSSLFKQSK